ncbi:hypothetical protein AB9P05_04575 [Roseivirga sp. BDSF3-8]|uniref:hypothetical protein n=1 Tax=Roseivirga sp. BDSF3-8 TaxID=3241598 RepID=UPI003531A1C4
MSDNTANKNGLALKDILLSLADGLNEAQEELRSVPPVDELGRPNTIYQLPYLDFRLQVTSEFEQEAPLSTGTAPDKKRGFLRFRAAESAPGGQTNTRTEVFSTISGRFVASVPNEGLPQLEPKVEVSTPKPKGNSNRLFADVTVTLLNSAGELVTNHMVHFDYDQDTAEAVNKKALSLKPAFEPAEAPTDSNGQVTVQLSTPKEDYNNGLTTVFTITAGLSTQTISISK